jgi:hypothetical protein
MEKLFGTEAEGDPGVYVTVHDGQVVLTLGAKSLDLFRGDTGFADSHFLKLLSKTPEFLGGDSIEVIMTDKHGNSCMIGS